MKIFAIVLIVLGTGGLAYQSAVLTASLVRGNRPVENVPAEAISVIDIQKVWVQDHFEATVRLKNQTAEHLKLVEVLNSCGCASSDIVESNLPADAVGSLRFRLKPDALKEHQFVVLYERPTGDKCMLVVPINFEE